MIRIALALALLAGCTLYWNDDKKIICNPNEKGIAQPTQLERDPYTGQCEAVGGGYECDNSCGPCAEDSGGDFANWASCSGSCIGLDESSCKISGGCQAEYLDDPSALQIAFWGCYPVEPFITVTPGTDCTKLDVDHCTADDECTATYAGSAETGATKFESCGIELFPEPPPPPAACDTLTSEQDCAARGDCEAVYDGYDCTCDLSGCTCKTEVYASCKAR